MKAIRSADTKPERIVRSLAHSCGYRFRLHRKDLPGKPDLVFPGRRAIIFVHGCFWHMHSCASVRMPKSNVQYWQPKLVRNQKKDAENIKTLTTMGWQVLTVWDCETHNLRVLTTRLKDFLEGKASGKQ